MAKSRNMLTVSPAPHLRDGMTTSRIMMEVCLALLPAGIASVVFFGARSAMLIVAAVITAIAAEYSYQKITKQKVTVGDWSCVVTGLLLAYNLPANTPLFVAVFGSLIAIILVKQLFGGIGSNFINPALAARAILFVSWSSLMSNYPQTVFMADAVSSATPLAHLATTAGIAQVNLWDLLIGNVGGVLGETSKLALLLGGIYLIVRKIVDWRIPVTFIATVFLCYLIKDGAEMALYQILAGSLFLGAFFMATDYSTSPITPWGRVLMGVGCGILLFVIRAYASYPEGCSFAILFMNVCTPIIDRYVVPARFGEVKVHG